MTKKRINIKSKLSKNKTLFFIFILVILCIFFMFIPLGFTMSAAYRSAGAIAGIILFYIIKLISDKDTSDYLSFIDIYSNKIVLVYKNKDKIINEHEILNKNIQSIEVIIEANDNPTIGDYSAIRFSSTTVNIITDNEPPIIFTERNDGTKFSGGPFDLAIKFIKYRKILSKFSYRIDGNSELANKEIEHALKTGHGYNFMQRLYNMGPTGKFCVFLVLFSLLLPIIMIILMFNTSNFEKYNQRSWEITEYNINAVKYYNNEQYEQGIAEAKKGISILNSYINQGKLDNKELYKALSLYDTIGDCERKLKNYEKAIDAYDYIIANGNKIPLDVYFKRGKCKYYLGYKEQALNDFQKYKQLVEEYIKEQSQKSTNKKSQPFYSNNDIEKVNYWIEKCN